MSKVFIIGAGFSKGLASAPLTNELFRILLNKSKKITREVNQSEWSRPAKNFLKLLDKYNQKVNDRFAALQRPTDDIETIDGYYPINIEYLCTIIDLNAEHSFNPTSNQVDLDFPISFLYDLNPDELKHLKRFFKTNIFKSLLPDQLSPKKGLLNKFADLLNEGDTILSFNYDLVLEQSLWENKIWSPIDGYGFINPDFFPKLIPNQKLPESKVSLLKLHGSINWKSLLGNIGKNNISVFLNYESKDEPFFNGLETKKRPVLKEEENYFSNPAILPSFIKMYTESWFSKIIRNSINALQDAKQIYLIGYSVPNADSISQFLISSIPQDSEISIINPLPDNQLEVNLRRRFGIHKVNSNPIPVEEWLQ